MVGSEGWLHGKPMRVLAWTGRILVLPWFNFQKTAQPRAVSVGELVYNLTSSLLAMLFNSLSSYPKYDDGLRIVAVGNAALTRSSPSALA